jgi:hypothetical protein
MSSEQSVKNSTKGSRRAQAAGILMEMPREARVEVERVPSPSRESVRSENFDEEETARRPRSRAQAPLLRGVTHEVVQRFSEEYKQYTRRMKGSKLIPAVDLIREEDLRRMARASKIREEDIMEMHNEEIFQLLQKMNEARTYEAWKKRFEGLKMEGASIHDFDEYTDEFHLRQKFAGERNAPKEIDITAMFLKGLKPFSVMDRLRKRHPDTVDEAAEQFRELLEDYLDHEYMVPEERPSRLKLERASKGPRPMVKEDGRKTPSRPVEEKPSVTCYYCNEAGHIAPRCPNRKPREGHEKRREFDKSKPTVRSVWRVYSSDLIGDEKPQGGFIRVECKVGPEDNFETDHVETTCFCDSGANISTVSRAFLKQFNRVRVQDGSEFSVELHDGTLSTLSGETVDLVVQLSTKAGEVQFKVHFTVVDKCREPILLGVEVIRQIIGKYSMEETIQMFQAEPMAPEEEHDVDESMIFPNRTSATAEVPGVLVNQEFPLRKELSVVVERYGATLFAPFDAEGLRVAPMDIKLKAGMALTMQPCRFIKQKLLQTVREELDRLESWGVIEKVEGAEMASPLVVVPKPDGKIRLAVDYRELNNIIIETAHQLPYQQTLFECLAGKRYYAKLDNLYGYHQLPLTEEAQRLCSMITPWGVYKMRMLGFGISSAPGIYQQRMQDVVLKDHYLKRCVVYIDDTIVYGDTAEEFLENLEMVLKTMAEFNVRLKPSKCSFGFSEVVFLGHHISAEGYGMTDERRNCIQQMPRPVTATQVRSFVGMVNFFRAFIPNLSSLLSPLTDLTKGIKKGEVVWTEAATDAFRLTKDAILNATNLAWLNEDDPLILYSDASDYGIGAALFQVQLGVEKPIRFVSHKLSDAATRWTVTEKECYALFYGVTQLQSFLLGRKFVIKMDHRNLLYLYNSSVSKLIRWRLRLQEFNFVIMHIPGITNVVADTLSRAFGLRGGVEEPDSPDRMLDVTTFHNDIVGHHGVRKTMALMTEAGVKVKDLKSLVTKWIAECMICQKIKVHRQESKVSTHHLHGVSPMVSLSADTVGPLPTDQYGCKYILVIMCNFTKYCCLYAVQSTAAMEYVRSILTHVGNFGIPQFLRTDGGSQFTAEVSSELSKMF